MDHFETMHTCWGYIENLHVNFCRPKIILTKLQHFRLKTILRLAFNVGYIVASLCNQILSGFASNQFEALHRCYKHNEDVHVIFSKQERHFGLRRFSG